ncbi:MarR family winged helix-turn-helix transcriptional regulator [Propionicimonas paludicola]|uniref:MarR family winged helix-turn-helix transcriptional regulator n=1 Tax=Propionicimonas paludicola TaxID=185243 RepID=UPI002481C91B|nr:MarR family transcriptional regulator [Propionicimonas paludicola]
MQKINSKESADSDRLLLDRQLCFPLYAASRAVTARYGPLLSELGLTYPQYLVMLVLWEQSPVSVGELGERLRLDSGTLSPLLKRLQAAGLVDRRRDVEDERRVLVALTPAGVSLRERARHVPAAIAAALGLDEDSYVQLQAQLSELLCRLAPANESQGAPIS